jgi:hypothetical protein
MIMDSKQANTIIDYIEAAEELARHDSIMDLLESRGYSMKEVDAACQVLGAIAGRDFSIL